MSNIEFIPGKPFAEPGEPAAEVIETIKKFLAMAEAGLLQQVHLIGTSHDGRVEHVWEGIGSGITLAGATTWSLHQLYASIEARNADLIPPA